MLPRLTALHMAQMRSPPMSAQNLLWGGNADINQTFPMVSTPRAGIYGDPARSIDRAPGAAVDSLVSRALRHFGKRLVRRGYVPVFGGAPDLRRLPAILVCDAKRLKSGAMLFGDRGYGGGWIRTLVSEQGAWAHVPPRRNRKDALCFSPYLYRERNLSSGSLARSNSVGAWRRATTNLRRTTSRSSSLHRYAYGSKLKSPRP